ncbi:MAG: hypothetical protein ACK4NA_09240 [Alphaproteobacteria bacterium]
MLPLAACSVRVGEDTSAYKWQSGDYAGYCRDAIAAVASRNPAILAAALQPATDGTAQGRAQADALGKTLLAALDLAVEGAALQRVAETAGPYGRGAVTIVQSWRSARGAEVHFGCIVARRPDGAQRLTLDLNSDLDRLRQRMLTDMQAAPGSGIGRAI